MDVPTAASDGSSGAATPVHKGVVLIVEDDVSLGNVLKSSLANKGYTVTLCMSGSAALNALQKGNFDVMLLDLIMPGMDGFAVLEEMKKRKYTVPVLVASNLGQFEDQAKAKELGAVGYFVKSRTPISELIKNIEPFLNKGAGAK